LEISGVDAGLLAAFDESRNVGWSLESRLGIDVIA